MAAPIWSALLIVSLSLFVIPLLWTCACLQLFSASGSTTLPDPSLPLGMMTFVGGAFSALPVTVFLATYPYWRGILSLYIVIGAAQVLLGKIVWSLGISWEGIFFGGLGGLLPLLVLRGIEYICSPEEQWSHSRDCPSSTELGWV